MADESSGEMSSTGGRGNGLRVNAPAFFSGGYDRYAPPPSLL